MGWDLINIASSSRRSMLSIVEMPLGRHIVRYSRYPWGTAGYLLSRSGAQKMLTSRSSAGVLRCRTASSRGASTWNCYGVQPSLVRQTDDFGSSISNARKPAKNLGGGQLLVYPHTWRRRARAMQASPMSKCPSGDGSDLVTANRLVKFWREHSHFASRMTSAPCQKALFELQKNSTGARLQRTHAIAYRPPLIVGGVARSLLALGGVKRQQEAVASRGRGVDRMTRKLPFVAAALAAGLLLVSAPGMATTAGSLGVLKGVGAVQSSAVDRTSVGQPVCRWGFGGYINGVPGVVVAYNARRANAGANRWRASAACRWLLI